MNRSCSRIRRMLSADLDGESSPAESATARRHVDSCLSCAQWLEDVQQVTRRAVLRATPATPDLTDAVMGAARRPDRSRRMRGVWARTALVSLGLVQLEWAIAGIAHDRTHLSRELVAFDLALALGVLAVALRPWRAAGLLPVLGALAALLVITSGLDLLDGRTTVLRELPHALVVLELVVVWRIRWTTGPVGALPPRPSGESVRGQLRRAA